MGYDRLTKYCSQVIFISKFFGDLLSTPPFQFLCCRPESNTKRPKPALYQILDGKDLLSKVRPFIFERVLYIPLEALKGMSNFCCFNPTKKYLSRVPLKNLPSTSLAIGCLT